MVGDLDPVGVPGVFSIVINQLRSVSLLSQIKGFEFFKFTPS
jgi:hypothetical protein